MPKINVLDTYEPTHSDLVQSVRVSDKNVIVKLTSGTYVYRVPSTQAGLNLLGSWRSAHSAGAFYNHFVKGCLERDEELEDDIAEGWVQFVYPNPDIEVTVPTDSPAPQTLAEAIHPTTGWNAFAVPVGLLGDIQTFLQGLSKLESGEISLATTTRLPLVHNDTQQVVGVAVWSDEDSDWRVEFGITA